MICKYSEQILKLQKLGTFQWAQLFKETLCRNAELNYNIYFYYSSLHTA